MTEASVVDERLIKGMFRPPKDQLLLVKYWNGVRKWGFTERDFAELGNLPNWPFPGRLPAVVLDVQLRGVLKTMTEAYEILKQVFPGRVSLDDFSIASEHVRLRAGCKHKRGLRWRTIDLGANQNLPIGSIKDPRLRPHSALLWAAVFHQQWVQSMDGDKVPWVAIPGYQVELCKGKSYWNHVPGIWASGKILDLTANFAQERSPSWGVPTFLDLWPQSTL